MSKYKYEFDFPTFEKGDCYECPLAYTEYNDMYEEWENVCVLGCDSNDCPLEEDKAVLPKVVSREYGIVDYYCPRCGKQQKVTFKTRREGCYCERCGQRLEAFKCTTEN